MLTPPEDKCVTITHQSAAKYALMLVLPCLLDYLDYLTFPAVVDKGYEIQQSIRVEVHFVFVWIEFIRIRILAQKLGDSRIYIFE